MKYYQLCIDGIDKTGKDVLWKELDFMCNHDFSINIRGLMSNLAYDELYNRKHDYDLEMYKNVITIMLTVDEDDWQVRCKAEKEKDVSLTDYKNHNEAFNRACKNMQDAGLIVFSYNTTYSTPYVIAKDIINKMKELNKE